MTVRKALLIAAAVLVCLTGCATKAAGRSPEALAAQRVQAYMEAFNRGGKEPQGIYPFLSSDLRARISEEDFLAAYLKERSYPYITPFYVFEPVIELSPDGMTGKVTFQQAARIVGMTWECGLVFEDGTYYFRDWEYLIDGSYLEKFKDIPYDLSWYYD